MQSDSFLQQLDQLTAASQVVIDRPKGSHHPRYAEFVYPQDYGYLAGTSSADGEGLDVWLGSLPHRRLTAVVCCVDLLKRDVEIKLLLGCTAEEMRAICQIHNRGSQSALLVERESRPD